MKETNKDIETNTDINKREGEKDNKNETDKREIKQYCDKDKD